MDESASRRQAEGFPVLSLRLALSALLPIVRGDLMGSPRLIEKGDGEAD